MAVISPAVGGAISLLASAVRDSFAVFGVEPWSGAVTGILGAFEP